MLVPGLTHAAGAELIMAHPFRPDEKSPSGMRFCAEGVAVTVVVVIAVVVTVVVVVAAPSISAVETVCHEVAVTLGVFVDVEV